jgi:hypothetical protein
MKMKMKEKRERLKGKCWRRKIGNHFRIATLLDY